MNEFQFKPPWTSPLPGTFFSPPWKHPQFQASHLKCWHKFGGFDRARNLQKCRSECDAHKISPRSVAWTTVKMKFSITEPSAKKCHDWTVQLRNRSPNQKLEWDSSSFHQLINSISINTWAIHPIPLSTGCHTLTKGWFSASSVCFILRQ